MTSEDNTAPASSPAAQDLKARGIRGAVWTILNQGLSQLLRFGSNVVLTRLLMPEAFGLMSLVFVFISGLEMLSDVGVGPAIIRSQRGEDRDLLDTAWTVQIIRGFVLFLLSLLVAWPAALFYHDSRLVGLIAVAGVGIAVRGFTPTRVHSLNRQLLLGRLTIVELTCQIASIGLMVPAAWLLHSVWALILGTLGSDVLRVVLSYRLLPGHPHRLHIDRKSVGEIVHVGRWIVVSTAITFAVGYVDRIVIGRMLSITELGVYFIALQIVQAVVGVGRTVSGRVLFPLLSETLRSSPDLFYTRLRRARIAWIVPTTAVLIILSFSGDWIIRLIYKPNYHDAGWMLRILATGATVAVLNQSQGAIWSALGEFRTIVVLMTFQIALTLACMFLGFAWRGTLGFMVGLALVELLVYPVQSFLVRRRKLWQPEIDFPFLLLVAGVVAVSLSLR